MNDLLKAIVWLGHVQYQSETARREFSERADRYEPEARAVLSLCMRWIYDVPLQGIHFVDFADQSILDCDYHHNVDCDGTLELHDDVLTCSECGRTVDCAHTLTAAELVQELERPPISYKQFVSHFPDLPDDVRDLFSSLIEPEAGT